MHLWEGAISVLGNTQLQLWVCAQKGKQCIRAHGAGSLNMRPRGLCSGCWDERRHAPCNSNRNRNCISHRNCDITELWHFIFLGPCCQRDAGCPNQINACFVAGRQDQKCPLGQSGAALPWLERVSRNLPAMLKGHVARSRMYLP